MHFDPGMYVMREPWSGGVKARGSLAGRQASNVGGLLILPLLDAVRKMLQ
jgi:hypothetical protein